jgi:hypothetical protein
MGREGGSPSRLQLPHTRVDGMALLVFMECILQQSARVMHAELLVQTQMVSGTVQDANS